MKCTNKGTSRRASNKSECHSGSSFSIPKGVFAVSLFGLFLGMSTTMVYSQLSLFMKNELHVSSANIALIDGIVEFLAYVVRIFSGYMSDYFGDRKIILFVGCGATLLARSMLWTAGSAIAVTMIQSVERLGNGLQASPRDALIADLSQKHERAKSFGFSRSLKTIGAFLGTPIAIAIMYATTNNYRFVFICAIIPVIIAIFCLLMVKTNKNSIKAAQRENPFKKEYVASLDKVFWKLMLLVLIFEMGHFSEHLLPIYANTFLTTTFASSVSMFISVGQVICSFTIGCYADKFGNRLFIKVCFLMMISACLLFIYAQFSQYPAVCIYTAAFLWGGQMTAIQGLFLSLISGYVHFNLRATAIGIYFCIIGVAYLGASCLGGYIWDNYSSTNAFLYTICVSLVAISLTNTLLQKNKW